MGATSRSKRASSTTCSCRPASRSGQPKRPESGEDLTLRTPGLEAGDAGVTDPDGEVTDPLRQVSRRVNPIPRVVSKKLRAVQQA
jgi:hypothetical protein